MKVALNQITEENPNKSRKKFTEHFESLLHKVAASALIVLIAVQAAFINPIFKDAVSNDNKLKGEPLEEETYFFNPCKMELKLTNLENCLDLEVLVNGEKRAAFDNASVLLDLKDGDVVELDAGTVLVEAIVKVSAVSSNISGFLGKTMSVTDGIIQVALVKPSH